jgi:hypothetical protein
MAVWQADSAASCQAGFCLLGEQLLCLLAKQYFPCLAISLSVGLPSSLLPAWHLLLSARRAQAAIVAACLVKERNYCSCLLGNSKQLL